MGQENSEEFVLVQYQALRDEILGIKERLVKIQLYGITGIPLVIGAGQKFDLLSIMLAAPLITLVFAFMVIFEQTSLMRAGAYIKQKMERRLIPEGFMGWEEWLEHSPKGRWAENFFVWSVHIVFGVYFLLGLYLSNQAVQKLPNVPDFFVMTLTGFYGGGFLLALYVVVKYLPRGTKYFED